MKEEDIEFVRQKAGCGLPLRHVHLTLGVFYVLLALLNGEALLHEVELMRFGRARDVSVALARPLAAVSHALGFGAPRRAIERWIGQE